LCSVCLRGKLLVNLWDSGVFLGILVCTCGQERVNDACTLKAGLIKVGSVLMAFELWSKEVPVLRWEVFAKEHVCIHCTVNDKISDPENNGYIESLNKISDLLENHVTK